MSNKLSSSFTFKYIVQYIISQCHLLYHKSIISKHLYPWDHRKYEFFFGAHIYKHRNIFVYLSLVLYLFFFNHRMVWNTVWHTRYTMAEFDSHLLFILVIVYYTHELTKHTIAKALLTTLIYVICYVRHMCIYENIISINVSMYTHWCKEVSGTFIVCCVYAPTKNYEKDVIKLSIPQ